jgi:hypothetical protein
LRLVAQKPSAKLTELERNLGRADRAHSARARLRNAGKA